MHMNMVVNVPTGKLLIIACVYWLTFDLFKSQTMKSSYLLLMYMFLSCYLSM